MTKFHSINQRQLTVKNFLKKNGIQSLQSLKEGFLSEKKVLPFAKYGDKVLESWIKLIQGIGSVKVGSTTKYYVKESTENNKSDWSAKFSCSSQNEILMTPSSPDKNPIDIFEGDRVTSTVLKKPKNFGKRLEEVPEIVVLKGSNCELPNFFSFPLIGDDNFLNLAAFDLEFPSEKKNNVRTCGHCVSGLKIFGAKQRILSINSNESNCVIVNVGSVDIAEGRQLIEMMKDFRSLLEACQYKQIKPVLTTLAPLPNYWAKDRKQTLEGFNRWIRDFSDVYPVIDLHKSMLDQNGSVREYLYQPKPRYISGSRRQMLLWNIKGRKRILNMLRNNLGEVLVFKNYIGDNCWW